MRLRSAARGTRYLLESAAPRSTASTPAVTTAPVLREVALRCEVDASLVVDRMLEEGFLAGIALREGYEGSELEESLLVAVTERRTREEIDAFVNALGKAAR